MTTDDMLCTEPKRWTSVPGPDAPDAEVLAYLRHCEDCAYHAAVEHRDDEWIDSVLPEASRALRPEAPSYAAGREALPRGRSFVGLRVSRGAGVYALVLLGMLLASVAYYQQRHPDGTTRVATAPGNSPDSMAVAERLAAAPPGVRAYEARVISDAFEGQVTKSGLYYSPADTVAATARFAFGTRLRVINPLNDRSIIVRVVDRGPTDGAINLSSAAAHALGFEGKLTVMVEILSSPARPSLGP